MLRLSFLLLSLVSGATLASPSPAAGIDAPDPQTALKQLYGGDTWDDARLSNYFGRSLDSDGLQNRAFVSVAFQSSFREGGQDKAIVIAGLTPRPADEYRCHACAPLLGGAELVRSGSAWKIVSRTQIIGVGNGAGNHFSLVKVGPDRYGVLFRLDDSHQGYEQRRIDVITAVDGALVMVLSIGFDERPGKDACADARGQAVNLEFAPGSNPDYFDAVATVQRNDGICGHLTSRIENARYRFENGKYEQIGTSVGP